MRRRAAADACLYKRWCVAACTGVGVPPARATRAPDYLTAPDAPLRSLAEVCHTTRMDTLDNHAVIAAWAAATDHLDDFGEEGDFTRQHLLNPAIFALLGLVDGRTILDAGCGQGYLCRLLAKRGARITGV